MMPCYHELERRFARIANLDNALGILQWDHQTMMPAGAADTRAETLATLYVLRHELIADPRIGEWLDEAEATAETEAGADGWHCANLREMRRRWLHAAAVPGDLVEANARTVALCEMTWRGARRDNDFKALLPSLSEVLTLQRRIAEAKAAAFGIAPYDALLDSYEPDGRTAKVDELFDDLAAFLPGMIDEALAHQARRPAPLPPEGPFPVDRQFALARRMMQALDFDFDRGRLDVSLHPFCGGADQDVRITIRYDEADFTKALLSVLHEAGHALYEQGRPRDWLQQPVGAARGMTLHESQSLLVEMQACRSRAFLEFLGPLMCEMFGVSGPAWEPDNLHRLYTRVERGLIRVDADEVTLVVSAELVEEFESRLRDHVISDTAYRLITLDVVLEHDMIGFMARVSTALAEAGISVMPFAAYSRDHVLVPADQFETALTALQRLQSNL